MNKKNKDKNVVLILDNLNEMPELDDYTGTDWYKVLEDIDKPELNVSEGDSHHTPFSEALKLEFIFNGFKLILLLYSLLNNLHHHLL